MDVEVLKQKILDLAIRGKLVPQDPNDEPASVLIEKIKAEKSKLVKEGKIKATKEESYIYKGSDNCYYEKIGNKVFDITDEIPFDIPTNWTFSRLDNYVKLVTDFVASGSFASLRENVKYYDEPNYAVLVRTCDFKSNFKDSLVYTDKHGYDFLSNSNLYGGEILLSNIGASIGKVFIVPYLNVRMTLAPNSIMVKLTNDELREYFYYLFLSPYGQKILNEISASSAQAKFNKTDFKKLIIPIPPLKEQKRINNILSKVNEHIENIYNEYNQIEELIKIAKSKILDEVFGDNSSYKSYYKIKQGELMNYCASITKGTTPTSYGFKYLNRGIPFIKVENVSNYCVNHDTINCYISKEANEFQKRSQLKENDILFSIAGTIGKICLIKKCDVPSNTNQAFAIISGYSNHIIPEYLMYYLEWSKFSDSKVDTHGLGMENATLTGLKKLKIWFPELLSDQQIIVKELINTLKILNSIAS